jgi:hypothetical protein
VNTKDIVWKLVQNKWSLLGAIVGTVGLCGFLIIIHVRYDTYLTTREQWEPHSGFARLLDQGFLGAAGIVLGVIAGSHDTLFVSWALGHGGGNI